MQRLKEQQETFEILKIFEGVDIGSNKFTQRLNFFKDSKILSAEERIKSVVELTNFVIKANEA